MPRETGIFYSYDLLILIKTIFPSPPLFLRFSRNPFGSSNPNAILIFFFFLAHSNVKTQLKYVAVSDY